MTEDPRTSSLTDRVIEVLAAAFDPRQTSGLTAAEIGARLALEDQPAGARVRTARMQVNPILFALEVDGLAARWDDGWVLTARGIDEHRRAHGDFRYA